jgi:ferritin-like metal-binding protein YciE
MSFSNWNSVTHTIASKKLVEKGLPSMIEAAQSPELRTALQHHLQETRGQVTRLESVFSTCRLTPDTKNNSVLSEIMDAAKDSASNIPARELRDAAQHGRALRDSDLWHPGGVGATTGIRNRSNAA